MFPIVICRKKFTKVRICIVVSILRGVFDIKDGNYLKLIWLNALILAVFGVLTTFCSELRDPNFCHFFLFLSPFLLSEDSFLINYFFDNFLNIGPEDNLVGIRKCVQESINPFET